MRKILPTIVLWTLLAAGEVLLIASHGNKRPAVLVAWAGGIISWVLILEVAEWWRARPTVRRVKALDRANKHL